MRGHGQHPGKISRQESARGRGAPAGARTPARTADASQGTGLTPEAVTALQGTAGNDLVIQMLRAGEENTAAPRSGPPAQAAQAAQAAWAAQAAAQSAQGAPQSAQAAQAAWAAQAASTTQTTQAAQAALAAQAAHAAPQAAQGVLDELDAQVALAAEATRAIERLTKSIGEHTVLPKMKVNVWDPGTWFPEDIRPEGKARLRRTLMRRLVRGEVFNEQELEDIQTLSEAKHKWLSDVEIGTYAEAADYNAKGDFRQWLKLSPGRRLLTATLAFSGNKPGTRASGDRIPADPAYTLGRLMATQGGGLSEEERKALFDERDEQIRQTAVSTLHPAGLGPADRHADADSPAVTKYAQQDENARDILASVLLILQQGLKIYDPEQATHVESTDDVIRALAHGGRVTIRIPALRGDESPTALTDFLGVTENGKYTKYVVDRGFATHRQSIGKNKEGEPGKFQEKGGLLASATNIATSIIPGMDSPDIKGVNFSGGGLGSKDVNGDVVLPNGSYGHMLLVFQPPTKKADGSLQVGLETIGPHAYSPVGYEHNIFSTEVTANPESPLHGNKEDKIGGGKLKHNQRLVNLGELPGTHWRTFLDQVKREWLGELKRTQDGSAEREALYRRLVGPRGDFRAHVG